MILSDYKFDFLDPKNNNWKKFRIKDFFKLHKETTTDFKNYPILSLGKRGIYTRDISNNEGQIASSYEKYNLVSSKNIVLNPMDLITGWADIPREFGLISPAYISLELINKKDNLNFFKYYFQSLYFEKIFFNFAEGVHYDFRWVLSKDTLFDFPIYVPDNIYQNKIVKYLDEKNIYINLLIEKNYTKIENLKEYKISKITELVSFGLNNETEKNTNLDWMPKVSKSWKLIIPKNIFDPVTRPIEKDDDVITCFRDGVVTLRKNRRTKGFTNSILEHGYQQILPNDLVVHEMDGFEGAIGISDSKGKSSPIYTVIPPTNNQDLNFWKYLLVVMSKTGKIKSLSKSIRERTTEFRWKIWGSMKFYVPDYSEQKKIVIKINEEVSYVDNLIGKLSIYIQELKNLKNSTISNNARGYEINE